MKPLIGCLNINTQQNVKAKVVFAWFIFLPLNSGEHESFGTLPCRVNDPC